MVSMVVVFMATASTTASAGEEFGFYGPYADYGDYYPNYAYDDSYYDDGSCYVVQRRVHTKSGWHYHPVQVCS